MSKLNYKLYQTNEWLNSKSGYKMVYSGEIDADCSETDFQTLDKLFELFNINHPENFEGRSMSSNDIVVLGNCIYLCDNIGWKELSIDDLLTGNIKTKFSC